MGRNPFIEKVDEKGLDIAYLSSMSRGRVGFIVLKVGKHTSVELAFCPNVVMMFV